MTSFSAASSALLTSLPPEGETSADQQLQLFALATQARTPLELKLLETLQARAAAAGKHQASPGQQKLVQRLLEGERLRIAFLNDNGFYAGAGIATARQARGFALAGHQVSVVGLNPYPETALSRQRYAHWLQGGSITAPIRFHAARQQDLRLDRAGNHDHSALVARLQAEEQWDLVILGNLHSDAIALSCLQPLLERQIPIVWFAHDLDLLGGGCGYPQYHNCNDHRGGCHDSSCPKPAEAYPRSSTGHIRQNYLLRSLLFQLPGVALATHSRWSAEQLQNRFPTQPVLRLPLGVDTTVFCPDDDRAALRRSLGLDPEAFTVVVGADSINRPGKGGEIVQALLPALLEQPNLQVVCLGNYPNPHPQVHSCGYLNDEAAIARVYASGDCYLNPVTIEAFGQTLLEASACGCIPVALGRCGVVDIIQNGRTGLLADQPEQLPETLARLRQHPELRRLLAEEGRRRVEESFSLERHVHLWCKALAEHWSGRAAQPATPLAAPLVSVVTTTFNAASELGVTAASLASQRSVAFEWVVQDGGSSDSTASLVQASNIPVRWKQQADRGIYDAVNKAIPRCSGEWVLVLQAGDWLAGADALQRLLASVDLPATDLIVAPFMETLIDGTTVRRDPANPSRKLKSLRDGSFRHPGPHWLSGMPSHQGLLLRREWCERFPFDTSFRISADWLQMFNAIAAGARVAMSDQLLSWYPNGGFSYENSNLWIEDVMRVAKQFQPDHTAVEAYFAEALAHHRQLTLKRRQGRQGLQRWYPQ